MSHYETLGVAREATPQEIKRAYRKLASKHHTDREDGDHDMMVKVNQAYAVLSDPERRRYYDETGEDEGCNPRDALEQEAANFVMNFFKRYIEAGDPTFNCIDQIVAGLEEGIVSTKDKLKAKEREIAKYEKRRTLVRRRNKQGADLYVMVLDSMIAEIRQTIASGERHLKMIERALEIAKEYEGKPEPKPATRTVTPEQFRAAYQGYFDQAASPEEGLIDLLLNRRTRR